MGYFPFSSAGMAAERVALSISIDGAIGPASARQLKEALKAAADRNAEVLIGAAPVEAENTGSVGFVDHEETAKLALDLDQVR